MNENNYEAPCEYATPGLVEDLTKKRGLHHVRWLLDYDHTNSILEISVELHTVSGWIESVSTIEVIKSRIKCSEISIKNDFKTNETRLSITAPYTTETMIYGSKSVINDNNIFVRFENVLETKFKVTKYFDKGYKKFKLALDDQKKVYKMQVTLTEQSYKA